VAYVLNLLADWHLKYCQDPDTARLFLERVGQLLPDTVEAQMAAQRIAHLASHESLMESVERTPIQLRTGVRNVGLLQDSSHLARVEEDPAVTAANYVAHLNEHPLDTEVREKLALLYAEHYQRTDLAVEQLEQLVEQPHQPTKQVVRWLNLMADLQIKNLHDLKAARRSLERIIDLYPAWACAAHARQRLDHLRLEVKGTEKTQDIKLGVYEQNIGLKARKINATGKRSPPE
jgi:hypothetical protein